MALLYVHGAGGYDDDQSIVAALRGAVTREVRAPRVDESDMSHASWSRQITAHLGDDVDTVVAHSFGGSTVLRMLVGGGLDVAHVLVVAAPDWGPKGWDVADYALPDDAGDRLPARVRLELHHCRDDEVVPADHLAMLAARLPAASTTLHETGGHQLVADGLHPALAPLVH